MPIPTLLRAGVIATVLAGGLLLTGGAQAEQTDSLLYKITKSGVLKVCQYPMYYSISYRDPKTGKIEGIDADLSKELAKSLDAKLDIVEFELRHVHR